MNRLELITFLEEEIKSKVKESKSMLDDIQLAINEESKSTAGDKHETTRELMQQERNKVAEQLNKVSQLLAIIPKIPKEEPSKIAFGSLVNDPELGFVFIGLPLGKLSFKDESLICISIMSPLAKKMMNS